MRGFRSLGVPSPRVEGAQKVGGKARYAVDVVLPGMLWVRVLRSPLPHARIRGLDVSRAASAPDVAAVLTGDDVRGARIGKKIVDMPLLADGVVRYVGEKVAAVAAESEEAAERAVDLLQVDYEELPAVIDPLVAIEPTAPVIHPDLSLYRGLLHPVERPTNVFVQLSWKKGDVEAGLRQSDLVVENVYRVPSVHQGYIEPHSCVVAVRPDGSADVWASTKSPYNLREQVGAALQVPPAGIVVHPCHVGGDFGGKGDANDVALCYALSRRCGRPVKLVLDYGEELIAGNPRHSAVVRIRTGVKKNGILIASHLEFIFDSGAYGSYRPQGFLVGAHDSVGPYRIPHCLVEEKYVYTNKVPCGYMRAPGHVQGHFATESQMDLVAERLGLDPVEFRRMNFMRDGDATPLGERIGHIRAAETLEEAVERSGYRTARKAGTGRGCAVACWISKGGEAYAFVTIDAQGGVTLSSAVADTGPGVYTVMRQIVSEELRVPPDSVAVEMLDTRRVVKDTGVRGSSSTRVHGGAALLAAQDARERLLRAAAALMGAAPEDLILHEGGVTHARAERRLSLAEIVRANGAPITGEGHYANTADGPEASTVAQVAEVEVDPETGEVAVKRLTSAHDSGTVLNPAAHQGQIEGGVIMGMGYALMEELVFDDAGKVQTASLGDYKIPNIKDIPALGTAVLRSNAGSGPYGSMSIGETAIIPTAAAIANAVRDAAGARITTLPITAEKVRDAIRKT
ncbi:MAG TPA: xanthine dehydrogenase family protein molybdopterin-binding subunit [candidate division Zixibacteria bacterium]|nr:xanthine dehydrogenase family protein molybdopterin-binding subunit [candidate division Zixibacteria bacterium]